jgi:hypothetical protein
MSEIKPPPHASLDESAAEDPRLMEAVRQYQAALDSGGRPSKREFIARYPDIAAELAECLDGLDFLHSAAPRLQPPEREPVAAPLEGILGDFRIVREIGRGGMGIVYEAVQLSLGRRVALKVLPLAATLDARQLQRFENEARAAAHLHHGHIVPVFAVGCERGVHYYAMQFIDGRTLAAVIADLGKPAAPTADTVVGVGSVTHQSTSSPAFFRHVATLGVQAAEALDYAHQMGVVHRDVKPANLLLDRRGELWVTDFGLARFQACPTLTSPGDLVGTLRYMSPEQAAGQPVIDPRSDIYSLGATLYELLTQQPAFSGRSRQECLRQILDEEPPPPRRLNRAVPPELETIVLKAMARQPEDRYASAKDLADDLRRFLDDQPVRARRPGVRERTAKWARRHRRVVAAALLGLVAAVVVLAVTTVWISRAEARALAANEELKAEQARLKEEETRTKDALAREVAQRDRAESNYRQARKVLDFLTRLGVQELANKPRLQKLRRHLLTELLAYYKEFIAQHGEGQSTPTELIEAQVQVAELLDEMGQKAESLAAFEKAMREQERLNDNRRPLPPFRLPRGLAPFFLLGQVAVQKDLKLSARQIEQVLPIIDLQRKPAAEDSPDVADAEKKLAAILNSEQAERLQQLVRQSRGSHALLDAETVEKLALTEVQQEEIRTILRKRNLGRSRGPGRPRPGHPPGPTRKQIHDQVLQVLRPEQRARWQEMLGEPFQGDIRSGGPRPHFQPRGRPG